MPPEDDLLHRWQRSGRLPLTPATLTRGNEVKDGDDGAAAGGPTRSADGPTHDRGAPVGAPATQKDSQSHFEIQIETVVFPEKAPLRVMTKGLQDSAGVNWLVVVGFDSGLSGEPGLAESSKRPVCPCMSLCVSVS